MFLTEKAPFDLKLLNKLIHIWLFLTLTLKNSGRMNYQTFTKLHYTSANFIWDSCSDFFWEIIILTIAPISQGNLYQIFFFWIPIQATDLQKRNLSSSASLIIFWSFKNSFIWSINFESLPLISNNLTEHWQYIRNKFYLVVWNVPQFQFLFVEHCTPPITIKLITQFTSSWSERRK